jgi:hypothetical protein
LVLDLSEARSAAAIGGLWAIGADQLEVAYQGIPGTRMALVAAWRAGRSGIITTWQ